MTTNGNLSKQIAKLAEQKKFQIIETLSMEKYSKVCYELGKYYYSQKQFDAAFVWFTEAGDHRESNALYYLSIICENKYIKDNGRGPSLEDAANYYMELAIKFNSPLALCDMGERLIYGRGVEKDCEKGLNLLFKAKALKYYRASEILSRCYTHGFGVEADLEKAHELLKESYNLLAEKYYSQEGE